MKNQSDTMERFRVELFDSVTDRYDTKPEFNSCLNAHGMYETMRFVLRLSPRNHQLVELIEKDDFEGETASPDIIRAYSTYIHETIHWWQHMGSTSGFVFSLSYLAQSHANMEALRKVIVDFGPKKPLKGWTDQVLLAEGHAAQAKLADANSAVNNALDIEYYKAYAYDPRKNIHWISDEAHFESVGHGHLIVYGQILGMVSDIIDSELKKLPDFRNWDREILRLRTQKCEGFFHGSPVRLPATGLRAIYEGQARFVQLQFLDKVLRGTVSVAEWKELGLLSGIYVEAFESFLKISESDWPTTISEPIIGLFLLVCDLAINPTRGFPLNIDSFEDFILDADVGVRFTRLSFAVKELPHLKLKIQDYSKDEYFSVSEELASYTGYDRPKEYLEEILSWAEEAPDAEMLMREYETFEFEAANLPIRVFLSHFLAFCVDKYKMPQFFCWPGKYLAGQESSAECKGMWLRHLSLFSDRGDKGGVYPRKKPGRSEAAVMRTFERFYSSTALYDLTRQWILKEGPFVCDFHWLSENYDQDHADAWADSTFRQVYGVSLSDFEIVE